MKAQLSDFYTKDEEKDLAFIWNPLLKAMGSDVDELFVTLEEFVNAMRSAITAHVYAPILVDGKVVPTILGMRITVL